MSLNRNIHLNTGTHGMKDGSTVFFLTSDTKDYLNPTSNIIEAMEKKVGKWLKKRLKEFNKKQKNWWITEGGQTFLNEDIENIIELVNVIYGNSKKSKISITFVDENTQPEYPKNCDVINAWCYSKSTPRCPFELAEIFHNSLEEETRD